MSVVCTDADTQPYMAQDMKTSGVSEVRAVLPVGRSSRLFEVGGFLGGGASLGCEFPLTLEAHRSSFLVQGTLVLDLCFLSRTSGD